MQGTRRGWQSHLVQGCTSGIYAEMGIVREWWVDVCIILGWMGGIDGLHTEVVKGRQKTVNGVVTRHVFLNSREAALPMVKFKQIGWEDMFIPEGMATKDIELQVLSSNFQGLHRTKEGVYPKKWNVLRDMASAVGANIPLNQEMFSSKVKGYERYWDGFRSLRSKREGRGQCNEIWCKMAAFQIIVTVLDLPAALILLVKSPLGVGVIGSVQLPRRNDEVEYRQQLVGVTLAVSEVDPQWVVIGGDRNRDIRRHAVTTPMAALHGMDIAMNNMVVLPKDFICIGGGV